MSQAIFISGTGTDVGKTFYSAFMVQAALHLGLKVCYWKPIQCGSVDWNGLNFPEGDSQLLKHLVGSSDFHLSNNLKIETGIFLKEPCSPHRAFELENRNFELRDLEATWHRINSQEFDLIVIEGAGGLKVPLSMKPKFDMLDLAQHFEWPITMACSPLLGTLNHTLLSLQNLASCPNVIPSELIAFTHHSNCLSQNELIQNNKDTILELANSSLKSIIQLPAWEDWGQWTTRSWDSWLNKHPDFKNLIQTVNSIEQIKPLTSMSHNDSIQTNKSNLLTQRLDSELVEIDKMGLTRSLTPYEINCQKIDFTSNDYLGVSNHPNFVNETAVHKPKPLLGFPTLDGFKDIKPRLQGALGSRLLGGDSQVFHELETKWAQWKNSEAALFFNSGYSANLGVIQALTNKDTHVFSDKLNHASIYDGIQLSGAKLHRYRHNDITHLKQLLSQYPGEQVIMSESVFSMDGDIAPLEQITELAESFNAFMIVDEAHSDGIWGNQGKGMVHHLGLEKRVHLVMSTLGKAFACSGAIVSGDKTTISYLTQRARSFIFSTATPPLVANLILNSMNMVQSMDQDRAVLLEKASWFRDQIKGLGLDTLNSQTQIIPVVLGSNLRAVMWSQKLQDAGFWVQAVRHPSVPKNTARLRINIHANHTQAELQSLVSAIKEILENE